MSFTVPVLLPLGSFTWGVEHVTQKTKKRKREISCLYRYSVRPLHPEVTVDDLFVFNFVDPLVNGTCTPSPMDGLVSVVAQLRVHDLAADVGDDGSLEAHVLWNVQVVHDELLDLFVSQVCDV